MGLEMAISEIICAPPKNLIHKGDGVWTLLCAILGSSMVLLDGTVVNVALAALQTSFHATGANLQWIVEAYTLVLASLLLLGGSFGDIFGRKRIFLLGTAIFALASAACAVSQNLSQLIAARAIQGIGGALLVPGSLSLISATFPEETRGRAIGLWSGSTAIAATLGPVVGGWLVQHASWRLIFLINLPLALVVLAIGASRMLESKGSKGSDADWVGGALATGGLGLVTYSMIEGMNRDAEIALWAILGAVLLSAFVFWEARTNHPMMPLEIFRSKTFSLANIITFLSYAALTGMFFYLPLTLIQAEHYPATTAGAALLPMTLLISIMSRGVGGMIMKVGSRILLAVGASLGSVGYVLLLRFSSGSGYWTSVFPGIVVLGLGFAILVTPLTTAVMNSVSEDRSGAASGINNAVSNTASLVAVSGFGILFTRTFDVRFRTLLAASNLSKELQDELYAHHQELGGILTSNEVARRIIQMSLANAFSRVLVLASVLSLLSALLALAIRDMESQQR